MRKNLFVLATVSLLLFTGVVRGGGGYLITVRQLPEYIETGKALELAFKVWVPSEEPQTGVHPVAHAANSNGRTVTTKALVASKPDEFTATLILPEAGDWTISIDVDYPGTATLPPITAIRPNSPKPEPVSIANRGLRLFTIKGCNGCHLHPEIKNGSTYGPDLTDERFSAAYLRRFLADPSITPVPDLVCSKDGSRCGSPYAMPNLNLKNAEIEALVAFLTKS